MAVAQPLARYGSPDGALEDLQIAYLSTRQFLRNWAIVSDWGTITHRVDTSPDVAGAYRSGAYRVQFQYETVLSELAAAGIRTITLNRPGSLNAMNRALIDDVARAFDDASADEATKVIIFTGAGRAFCAGDDRREHVHPENEAEARDLVDAIQRATLAIIFGHKPVVGAINGWAVGGGFEWAINCDFPIWAENAKGFFPEVSLNLFVTGGVTSLLPALVGLNMAREMLFFGDRYDAVTLAKIGVAWRVVPDNRMMEEARAVALKLASLPPLSVRAMRRTLYRTAVTDLLAAMQLETEATVTGFLDPETTKRLTSF